MTAAVWVASALILKAGRVLLGLRAPHRRICPDCWDLIGGHLEAGETPQAALCRELLEEIGVRPLHAEALMALDFSDEAQASVFMQVFLVSALDGEPRIANDEHAALSWFELTEAAELPNLASERYRPVLRALATGRRRRDGA